MYKINPNLEIHAALTQAAYDRYHRLYDNDLYCQISREMYRDVFGVKCPTKANTDLAIAEDMNAITNAALQLCGHPSYKDATTRAAMVAATYSSHVLCLVTVYLRRFMK